MKMRPCSITINTTIVLELPCPASPHDATKALEQHMSYDVLKNATIHVQPIKEPFEHLN
jgi:hypothetical protein